MEIIFIKKCKSRNTNIDYDIYRFYPKEFNDYMNTTTDDLDMLDIDDYLLSIDYDIYLNTVENQYYYFDVFYINKNNETDKFVIEYFRSEIESIIDQLIEHNIISDFESD